MEEDKKIPMWIRDVDDDFPDNVNAPSHYLHGKKETIDVISDCMTNDEFQDINSKANR